jgi:hypothetical protein
MVQKYSSLCEIIHDHNFRSNDSRFGEVGGDKKQRAGMSTQSALAEL